MRSLFPSLLRSLCHLLGILAMQTMVVRHAAAAMPDSTGVLSASSRTASVVLWNRNIMTFRSAYEGLTPKERANLAGERMNQVPADLPEYRVMAVEVLEGGNRLALIKVNGRIMFAVTEADADTTNGESFELAKQRAVIAVSQWMEARRAQYRLPMLIQSAGIALLATVVALFAALLLGRVFVRILGQLKHVESGLNKRFMIGNFNLAPYLVSLGNGLVKMFEVIVLISLTYLWLTYILSLFPYTQPWSRELSGFLLDTIYDLGHSVLVSIPSLFTIGVIFFMTRLLVNAVSAFFIAVESSSVHLRWFEPETAKATRRIVVVLIWVFALVVAYPLIPGSETKAFQGISVFLGLMVSLGSAGLVGQLIGGIVTVYTKSFQPGDYVKIGDHEGVVRELGMLAAKIVTIRKEEVTIPNALLMGSTVINYSKEARRDGAIVATSVTIGYDAPWRQVHALLLVAAGRTDGILHRPEPYVLQKSLSDFYVEYTLMFSIERAEERFSILSELHGHIQDAFNEYGVQIMSPHFRSQPDKDVLVPKERWSAAPASQGRDDTA